MDWSVLLRYGMARNGTVRYCTVRYGTIWYGTVWYGMVWYGMVRCLYGTVRYGLVRFFTVWYGSKWGGTVSYGTVWYDMVWYGTGLYGTVRYFTVQYAWDGATSVKNREPRVRNKDLTPRAKKNAPSVFDGVRVYIIAASGVWEAPLGERFQCKHGERAPCGRSRREPARFSASSLALTVICLEPWSCLPRRNELASHPDVSFLASMFWCWSFASRKGTSALPWLDLTCTNGLFYPALDISRILSCFVSAGLFLSWRVFCLIFDLGFTLARGGGGGGGYSI